MASSITAEAREKVQSFRDRHVLQAVAALALDCVWYIGLCALIVFVPIAAKLILSLALGLVISRLFVLGHDACHGSLFSSRRANEIAGRLSFLPSYMAYSLWTLGHNRIHHAFTNLKGKDYVWTPMSLDEYRAAPLWRRALERLYRNPIGHGLYYLVELYWKRLLFPSSRYVADRRREYYWDSAAVTGFALAQVVVFAVAAGLTGQSAAVLVAAGVILPFVVWNALMGLAIFLHHTHPGVAWFDDMQEWSAAEPQLRNSVHIVLPRWFGLLLHNIMDHTAHHIDPLIPLFQLPQAQATIETHFESNVQVLTLSFFTDAVKRCKLYDYGARRWLYFNGEFSADNPLLPTVQTPKLSK